MIRQFVALYARYEAAHLRIETTGSTIYDISGRSIGHVDTISVDGGRLRVRGWAKAARLRLVLGGADAQAAPILRRPDVATATGLPETVGFDLSLPAKPRDLEKAEAPGLIITPEPGAPEVEPLSLPMPRPGAARARLRWQFLRDVTRAMPPALAWFATRQPRHRTRVRDALRLQMALADGPLEPRLFAQSYDPESPVRPQTLTIVLPVYNAFDLLPEVLERVEAHTDLPWRLLIVEDCSTDAQVRPFLQTWAASRAQVTLIENERNLGFIASVNRAFKAALAFTGSDEGPVVLLNSDAFVPQGWASRLVRPFQNHEDVASVTPMSNDAEIFTTPVICEPGTLNAGQGDAIDKVAQSFAPEALLSVVPTGVGFCMGVARRYLAQVPSLDTAFGRGYGEEVDWCQKVAQLGGRHLGLPGLFVEHRGGSSFGSVEKRALIARNNALVAGRYPEYDQKVQDFIAADPMRTARLALGLAWAGSLSDEAVPVYLAHAMGGGADIWLEHRMKADLKAGKPSVVLRIGTSRRWQLELVAPGGRSYGQSDDAAIIEALLAVLPKRHVVYSCGVGDPDPLELPELLRDLMSPGDTAEMLFHDYFPLSPAYTLLDADGAYRGPVDGPRDDPAHNTRRLDGRLASLSDWQRGWAQFAKRATLTVFSEDSAAHVAAVWPDLKARIALRPHILRQDIPKLSPPKSKTPVIAVLGNIGLQKGAGVVQDLGDKLASANAPAKLVLIGNIDPAFALADRVEVEGDYRLEELAQLARRYGISHWLIPSIWPETFCYTVHEALATGLPTLAFDIGAQGDAVKAAPNGQAMPFDPEADLAQTILTTLGLAKAPPKRASAPA